MDFVKLYARAKINIGLDVLGKLDTGYHNLKTIMQSVRLADTIFISKSYEDKIHIKTNIPWLPTDHRNLVYKTAQFLKTEYKIKEGINITLLKSIPIAAGLAGGSSDCAATLIGIRNLFKLSISNEELLSIGAKLGADVAFCIKRGTALAEGIGDILTQLKPFPKCFFVISKPPVSVSTEEVFNSLNLKNINKIGDIEKLIYYIEKKDIKQIGANMFNTLEEITLKKYPCIQDIKNIMIKNNTLGCLMSGSGSSVFGIWENKIDAVKTARELKYSHNIKETFVTIPFNNYI